MNCIFLCLHLISATVIQEESTIEMIYEEKSIHEEVEKLEFYEVFQEPLFFNKGFFEKLTNELAEKIYTEPENARINKNGVIKEEKSGLELDVNKLENQVSKSLFEKHQQSKIYLPTKEVFPRVTSELLSQINERKLNSYVTHFKENNKERTHNIELATKAIDNYVVFPNESFSFNKVVGQRTEKKGYKKAPVIVKGEISEGIGGGICQVSSTLFNAVELKGIEITERFSHSRPVEYVPKGKDATVSWWGPDFVFKNTYAQPILIKAKAENGKMIIDVYGANDLN